MKFSLQAQIEEVQRELEQRAKVYPSLVKSRGMRQSVADFHVARMEAVKATLLWLQQNETEIRQIMAERRKAAGAPLEIDLIDHSESIEVRFSDGRESVYFYHEHDASRRAVTGRDTPAVARKKAEAFAAAERNKN